MPEYWIGKRVRVTVIDDEPKEPPITSKEELKSDYAKFKRHVRGATRLAKRNVNFSEPADK